MKWVPRNLSTPSWFTPVALLKELERKLKENQELAKRMGETLRANRLRKDMAEPARRFEAT